MTTNFFISYAQNKLIKVIFDDETQFSCGGAVCQD